MPPRRSHKKSRLGCKRCKFRKIKCDEARPICGGCSKHGVACDFESPSPSSPSSENRSSPDECLVRYTPPTLSSSSTSSSSSYSAPSPQFSLSPADASPTTISILPATSRLLELRLMHNYTAVTSYTLATGDEQESRLVWHKAVPALALNSPCLMDAILAVSAMHMRKLNPGDQTLVRASHAYMASALSQYSSTLSQGLDESNAEAVFATAAMIIFQASAARIFMGEDRRRAHADEVYTLPLQWFHSFQGMKAVVTLSWRWIRDSAAVFPIISSQPTLSLDLTADGRKFFGPLLDGLDAIILEYESEDLQTSTRHAYEHSIAFISWAHEEPNQRRILSFPAAVSKRFVDLIEQKAPLALVIIATFFAMTKAIEHEVWWLTGIAKMEVSGIYGLLPEAYRPMMAWAIMVAHAQTPISDDIWGASWYSEGKTEELDAANIVDSTDLMAEFNMIVSL